MTTSIERGTTDLGLDEAIVVSDLSIYGVRIADLRVRRGEIVALVGPNAAGKSTVSHALVGALPTTTGTVRMLGLDPMNDRDELKLRVGFLIRDLETMGSLSSRDVLDICAAVRGCTAAFALELAERLQLDLDRPMGQLCRGQLRRLGLVQALMHRPEAIVLDDPMTDLDEHGRRELAVVLREVAAAGAAVLVTASSAADVDGCATRIATFSVRPDTDAAAVPNPDAIEAAVLDTAAAAVGGEREPHPVLTADVRRPSGASRQPSAMERWLDLRSPVEAWQPARRRARRLAVRRLRTSSRSP